MLPQIGTSGFQYAEWKRTFYPDQLPLSKMLAYYATRFSTTEINYSFRRIPSAKTIDNWYKATPDRFTFSLKAPQKITHFARLRDCSETLTYFHQVVSALRTKLGAILFQLPPNLTKDRVLLAAFLDTLPEGMRAAFEFRHVSWFADEIFSELRRRNAALCIAESSTLATPPVVTADFGYLRLRREDYERSDIGRWAAFLRSRSEQWRDAYIYFKHEDIGVGPKFAAQLMQALA